MKSFSTLIILFLILIGVGFFYKKFESSCNDEDKQFNDNMIQKYLLSDANLDNEKKPILWIHIPYEYNARNWQSFGSRSSFDLNQPYLYLTVKSIINQCSDSFKICIIDDHSFDKLLPKWKIDMSRISNPISDNMRTLGFMKLLYKYGGLLCPISFVCMKNLLGLYNEGTQGGKMFLCETNDKNVTSSTYDFYPNISFCGAPKETKMVSQLIDFIQRTISTDFTAESKFLGSFDRWCESRIKNRQINKIDGSKIGIKTLDDTPIKIDDLMSNHYLKLLPDTYGILIPADEILNRVHYQWFASLSQKQVIESDTIIGNYLLLSNAPDCQQGVIESLENKPPWVGFWKTPLYDGVYGLKPNNLGDNLLKEEYPGK
jgi:hypothetical protein